MLKYEVVLKDKDNFIKDIATAFKGPNIRLRFINEGWILEADEFELCETVDQVLKKAEDYLFCLNVLMGIYPKIVTPLEMKYINYTNAQGKRKRRIWGRLNINIYDDDSIIELSHLEDENSKGSLILMKAYTNPKIKELLSIIGLPPMKWPQVYDVIEFLGGDKGISRMHLATIKEVEDIRQTANYYRHLGSPRKSRLP